MSDGETNNRIAWVHVSNPKFLHYWLTATLGILVIPACLATRLRLTPPPALGMFLLGWGLQSIIWAAVLFQFGVSGSWAPFRRNILRFVPALFMTAILLFVFGLKSGVMIAIVGLAVLEFYYRKGNWKSASSALLPWLYLAVGIQLALYFSSVIVSLRPCTEYDRLFESTGHAPDVRNVGYGYQPRRGWPISTRGDYLLRDRRSHGSGDSVSVSFRRSESCFPDVRRNRHGLLSVARRVLRAPGSRPVYHGWPSAATVHRRSAACISGKRHGTIPSFGLDDAGTRLLRCLSISPHGPAFDSGLVPAQVATGFAHRARLLSSACPCDCHSAMALRCRHPGGTGRCRSCGLADSRCLELSRRNRSTFRKSIEPGAPCP